MAYHCPRCKQTRKPIHITIAKRLRPSDTAKTLVGAILRRCNVCQTKLRHQPTPDPRTCVSTNPNAFQPPRTNGVRTLFSNRVV